MNKLRLLFAAFLLLSCIMIYSISAQSGSGVTSQFFEIINITDKGFEYLYNEEYETSTKRFSEALNKIDKLKGYIKKEIEADNIIYSPGDSISGLDAQDDTDVIYCRKYLKASLDQYLIGDLSKSLYALKKLEDKIIEMQGKAYSKMKQAAESFDDTKQLNKMIASVSENSRANSNRLNRLQSGVEAVKEGLAGAKEDLSQIRSSVDGVKSGARSNSQSLGKIQSGIETLSSKLGAYEQRFAEMSNNSSAFRSETDKLRTEISKVNGELSEIKEALEALREKEESAAKSAVDQVRTNVGTLSSGLRSVEDQLKSYEEELQKLKEGGASGEQFEEMNKQLEELKTQLSKNSEDISGFSESINGFETQLKEISEKIPEIVKENIGETEAGSPEQVAALEKSVEQINEQLTKMQGVGSQIAGLSNYMLTVAKAASESAAASGSGSGDSISKDDLYTSFLRFKQMSLISNLQKNLRGLSRELDAVRSMAVTNSVKAGNAPSVAGGSTEKILENIRAEMGKTREHLITFSNQLLERERAIEQKYTELMNKFSSVGEAGSGEAVENLEEELSFLDEDIGDVYSGAPLFSWPVILSLVLSGVLLLLFVFFIVRGGFPVAKGESADSETKLAHVAAGLENEARMRIVKEAEERAVSEAKKLLSKMKEEAQSLAAEKEQVKEESVPEDSANEVEASSPEPGIEDRVVSHNVIIEGIEVVETESGDGDSGVVEDSGSIIIEGIETVEFFHSDDEDSPEESPEEAPAEEAVVGETAKEEGNAPAEAEGFDNIESEKGDEIMNADLQAPDIEKIKGSIDESGDISEQEVIESIPSVDETEAQEIQKELEKSEEGAVDIEFVKREIDKYEGGSGRSSTSSKLRKRMSDALNGIENEFFTSMDEADKEEIMRRIKEGSDEDLPINLEYFERYIDNNERMNKNN